MLSKHFKKVACGGVSRNVLLDNGRGTSLLKAICVYMKSQTIEEVMAKLILVSLMCVCL